MKKNKIDNLADILTCKKLQTKFGIAFSLLAVLICAVLTFSLYLNFSAKIHEDTRRHISDMVSIASLQIDGNEHSTLVNAAQEDSPAYMRIKNVLQHIRGSVPNIRYIYTWRRTPDGKIIFVVDAETNPTQMSHLGEVYDSAEPELLAKLSTLDRVAIDEKFTNDKWGVWLSGYAPFYKSDGQMEGILGLDVNASDVLAHERQFLWLALAVFAAAVPFVVLLGLWFGRKLAAPIVKLTIGSTRIAQGDLTYRVEAQTQDELGQLADSFNKMAEDLGKTTTSIENLNQEITLRKISEAEVRRLARQIEFILGATKAGLDIVDSEFNISYVDSARQKIYGDPAGRKCYEYFKGKDEICADCGVLQALATKSMVVKEQVIYGEDSRPVHVTNVPFQEPDGQWLVASFSVDISELKQAQNQQDELMRKMAEVNNELKEFAYVVSHDLKAPLRGIKTIAGWLVDDYADKLDEAGKEQLKLLQSRVERMHNLIEGVLQYSRIGLVKEQEVRVDLNELAAEAIDMVAAPPNVAVTIEGRLPEIVCERTRIGQIFQNLISNAVKYMDKPQGRIKISCIDKNNLWEFSVSDNGPGIEEKHFEKIFKIFQTLSSKDDFESTGVGLTLVKKIVELYGGAVWVQSKAGEGSTFYFTLPRRQEVICTEMTLVAPC